VKYGIDPTAPDVHLGHTVPLRLLKVFQNFGHQAVIIIGNATAKVGDPSGRDKTRAKKTEAEIRVNAARYLEQIAKVVDLPNAEIEFNDQWFDPMRFDSLMEILGQFTIQQILERDDFSKRLQGNIPIYIHELMYPLMQGYDSVMVRADIEIGGTEQLFNMMLGRDLQRIHGKEPQVVVTVPILRGTDGKRRMGKSLGNYVGIVEQPFEMFSKVMSIPDELVHEWFLLLTDNCPDAIETSLVIHHPMNAKKLLARCIVREYHGDEEALKASERWTTQFSKKEIPHDVEEVVIPGNVVSSDPRLISLLKEMGLTESLNEARRLITQGAVSLFYPSKEPWKVPREDANVQVHPENGLVVKIGRKVRKLKVV